MAKIFTDINIALRHVISHVGLSEVKREGKNCEFEGYDDYQILIALYTETAVTEDARIFFENFALKKGAKRYVVRNYLYASGTFKLATTLQVGDLFWSKSANAEGADITGIVLEKNQEGQITKYVALEKKMYKKYLVINQETIQGKNILEAFSLVFPGEALPKDSTIRNFYGNFYEDILRRRGEIIYGYKHAVGSTIYEVLVYTMEGFFKYISFGAPAWVTRRFLMLGSKIEYAKYICAGLGKGVEEYDERKKLNAGTMLFTKEKGISILLGSSEEGRPVSALVPAGNSAGYNIEWVRQDMITHFWVPSIEPFAFLANNTNKAFKDINKFIGMVHCLYGTYYDLAAYNRVIFGFSTIVDAEIWHPEVYQVLRNANPNQNAEYWVKYLADKGNGIISTKLAPQLGDFLFFEHDGKLCGGVALDNENMIYAPYWAQEFKKGKIEKLKNIWRPALQKTK